MKTVIKRHYDNADRGASLSRCVPDLFKYRTILYVGARCDRMDFGEELKNVPMQIVILEAWAPNVEFLKAQGYKVVHGDVRECNNLFLPNVFDVVFWWHGPEHLAEKEIPKALMAIEKIAKFLVVCGCPWGRYDQGAAYGNPFEVHQSTLDPELFNTLGYNTETLGVKGMGSNITIWKQLMSYKELI